MSSSRNQNSKSADTKKIDSVQGLSAELKARQALPRARRVIIKVGTRVIVEKDGTPMMPRLKLLRDSIGALRGQGIEVVLVTSGAIGISLSVLGLPRKPKALAELQMCAAVGQSHLMTIYASLFKDIGIPVGQVLLTYDDLRKRDRHLNARNTLHALLRRGVLPIINENDVVSVDEIRFGDNDVLASLVSTLVDADAVLLLSTTDGLREFPNEGRSRRVSYLSKVDSRALSFVSSRKNELSSGGMSSKLLSAQRASENGALVVIANGLEEGVIERVFAGEDCGTLIGQAHPSEKRGRINKGKKRWLKDFQKSKGSVVIDRGAERALLEKGSSLLPVGVRKVQGTFQNGDLIDISSLSGATIARGLAEFSSSEVETIRGKRSAEVRELLGGKLPEEIVHRDNLVILEQ